MPRAFDSIDLKRFSERWIIGPIRNQLKQGISVDRLGWSISLGIHLGIFPIMGSTSLLCFLFGWFFKLNQPVLHLFKTIVYPLHLILILGYIRLGQMIHGVPLLSLSIPEMLNQFRQDPGQFVQDFSLAALHGVEAWALCSLIFIPMTYALTRPFLSKILPS